MSAVPNVALVAYELTFTDTARQVFREPLSNSAHGTPPGRRGDVTGGFEGFGTISGWVKIDGERTKCRRARRAPGTGTGAPGEA